MKRLFAALVTMCLLLVGILGMNAYAESAATRVDLLCTLNTDGDCIVSSNVLLRLEAAYEDFYFPIPANAKNITMNGSSVSVTRTSAATNVDISKITRGYTGAATIRLEYTIPDAVHVVKVGNERKLQLELPLLSGFRYPVESLGFTVTMPNGEKLSQPNFTSIYRQSSIEADLHWEVVGSQIIGSSKVPMNDREGVTMYLMVPESMFPGVSTYIREGNPELTPMIVFAVLALVYWILFLFTLPLLPAARATAGASLSQKGKA